MTARRTTDFLVPLAPALLLFVVLAAFVAVDPPTGFTSSRAPYADGSGLVPSGTPAKMKPSIRSSGW